MTHARLTPFIVARSQLITALDLFFADSDPISVQALAGNARELLERLCRLEGIEPMTDLLLRDHPDKQPRDMYAAINLYRNCFKHLADNDAACRAEDQATLDQFDDTKNDYLLFICIEDYIKLRKRSPVAFQIYLSWFYALHADILTDGAEAKRLLEYFSGITEMTREQQKRGALAVITRYSNDPSLLAHPDTEPLEVDG